MGNELETLFNELSKLFQLKSTYRTIYRAIHLIRLRQQQQLRNYTPLKELINNNESSQERHWINFSFAAQHEDNFGKWLKVIDEHRHEIVPLPLYPLQRLSAETVAEVKQSCVIILMIVFFASLLSRLSNKSQTSYHRSVGIHISLVFMLLLKGKHTHTQAHTLTHIYSLAGGKLNYSSLITFTWNAHTDELCTLAQINETRSRPKQQQQQQQQIQQQLQQLQHQQQLQ